MALSFSTVEKAYKVFHTIKQEYVHELIIPSWPKDMGEWNSDEQENPELLRVHGWGKKSDDGWESISFFIENPTEELKSRFKELSSEIKSNTNISEPYHRNKRLWVMGWF